MNQPKQSFNYSVIEIFEAQVQKTPSHLALNDIKNQYTYQALNEKVNQFANALKKKSVEKGDFVTILLEPSADFIICILAIVKLGAIYVPLDTLAPKTRLKDIIDDAKPKLIITNEEYQLKLNDVDVAVCPIKQLHLKSISYSSDNEKCFIDPQAPVYMIYTSGSTGKPKGVIIPHQAVVNLALVENYASVQAEEVVAQFNNLAFDASIFEIWSALLNGGLLQIIPQEVRANYTELKKILKQYPLDYLLLPTGFFHQLIKSAPNTLNSAKTILFGGEQINPVLLRQFIEYRKHAKIPLTLINGYGPSEGTTFACRHIVNEQFIDNDDHLSAIGVAFKNVDTYVLDEEMNRVDEGELYISGIHLALGYHNCPDLNAEKFINNPFNSKAPFQRLYKTGDLVKKLSTGELLYTGRVDDQVKVGGFRIHLSEVERQLLKHEAVSLAAVTVELGGGLHKMLTAYLVFSSKEKTIHADELRAFLSEVLPSYMLPAKYVMVDELPLTPIGKVDKRKLDQIPHTDLSFHIDKSSSSTIEETIKIIWKHLLNRSSISVNKNLFDLGANSLLITEACSRINNELHTELEVADLLAHPTIHKLSRYIEGDIDVTLVREKHQALSADIAIIGMSCRFPQADNVEEFWNNICKGRDCLTRFDPKEINTREAKNINFVPVKGILSDIEQFDASFFNFSPVDANITDPQQRVFLECTWEALEHAAVAPNKDPSKIISVFAGMTDSSYLQENLLKNNWFCREYDRFGQRIATSMSMLSTQTSYRLNLKGRSVNVNTACSTGLIAVDHACQDLILGHSDIAIAGASSITLPHLNGYIYQQGSILSPDGHCRPFADEANGTVFSDGVGVVVLKRLEDAIRDNDTVYAVIKARGVNNDGLNKLGFTAPSISGQASCIKEALAQAQLTADDISYIEAHGTATALGDIIEINALTSVYREQTDRKQFCSLGSVKANIGHTDATAGIAGLIKTALCLYHKKIPPLVHFQRPNPNLALDDSPFFVTKELKDWHSVNPRYAGISSFGVGGTNIHMILSDYQHVDEQSEPLLKDEILFISAKTEKALTNQVLHFHHYLNSTHQSLNNVAYTTHTGREDFQWRRFAIGKTLTEVQNHLTQKSSVFCNEEIHSSIVFMFSGQGMQYPQMAMELFDTVPCFKDYVQKGIDLAKTYLNCDLLEVIRAQDSERLKQTQFAQPALFIIEYALSRLLMDCGIKPDALIGHSIGEYVAACLAGIFSFEDGIALVCERGLLMAKASAGEMLAVECSAEDCLHYQSIASVDLALHNARNHYVFAGSIQNIACLEEHLKNTEKTYHKLTLSHAFHSRTMDSLEQAFKAIFTTITLSAPTIPLVSNVTGDWLSAADAVNPDYWYRHLRHTVQLAKGIDLLLEDEHPLFLEVGFGQALCGFVKNLSDGKAFVTHTLPNHHRANSDLAQFLNAMGELWSKGVQVHLEPLYEPQQRQHIPLPTYAFQKQRYWVNPDTHQSSNSEGSFYAPVWTRQELNNELSSELKNHSWIIFKDKIGIGHELINILSTHEVEPIIVEAGNEFSHVKPHHFIINPAKLAHYIELIKTLGETLHHPIVIHCWSYELAQEVFTTQKIDNYLDKSFYSLLHLSQAYLKLMGTTTKLQCRILTCGTQNILGGDALHPLNSSLVGICRVIPLEHSSLNYQLIDIASHETPLSWKHNLIDMISSVANDNKDTLIAYRNNYRWTSTYVKSETKIIKSRLSDKGVYLITGGLGGLGLALSEAIVAEVRHPILVLCSRAPCAPEKEWPNILRDDKHVEYQKIRQLQALKNKGATVLTQEIDITDEGCVEHLFAMLYQRFGKINGLIHAAGVAGEGLVQLKTRQTAQQVFLPKIHGTYYLAKASQNLPAFDFVVLMSSIAAVTGLKGQVDYCGANACLDSFASSKLFNAKHSLSLNWNTWREIGMSVSRQRPEELNLFNLDNDISPDEGKSLFLQALSSQHTNLVVSNYDIAHYQERLLKPSEESRLIENKAAREYLHLNNSYSEPQGSLEKQLAQIWQDNLCIETIGRDDDFFALGGHSLKALSLIEKINSQCKSTLSIQHLYKAPTIATLSKYLQLINNEQIIDIIIPLNDIISTQPKIFFCHPVSGMVYCFNALVSNWDLSVTVYGMQDPSISAGELLYDSIHSMAEHYAAAIKRIAPEGPYYLLGYSLGGAVVYEIAHLLRQENQQIALLALIESWCVFSEQHHQPEQLIENFLSSHDSTTKDLADLSLARMQLLLKHRPTQTHQDILLFKASELYKEYQAIDDPYNGWSKFTKGTIDCKIINSNHDTIINAENSKLIIDYLKKTVF